jgi:DHA2 family multidrug resistance protein
METGAKDDRLRWLVLLTVIIGTFLGRLDQTIVNLALPKIILDFKITVSSAGWIATAYILANAIFVPIWGKLGDTIGRKRVYTIGFIVFILGSVLAGLSWNLGSMIIFRVIQAIAGSADYPTAMAILAVTFKPGKERAQALGLWSASFAAAVVFGPLIGGPLIDNFGWRSVFLVNLPIGVVGLIMALTFIKESVADVKTRNFDWWGALSLGTMLAALVLVLDKGLDWGWLSPKSFAAYGVALIALAIFVRVERRQADPIVDFKFFRNSIFVGALVNNFIVFMGMMGSVFLIPVFAQTYLGLDATQTGYLFMPMAFGMMAAAPLGGALTGKVQPRYVIMFSTAVAALGLFLFSRLDPRSTPIDIVGPLLIMALGMGFGMAQRTNIIASAVPTHEVGIASSVLALVRNISGAFGIAIFGTILSDSTKAKVLEIAQHSVIRGASPADYGTGIALIILKAQVAAYDHVFIVSSIVVAVGAAAAFWIRVSKDKISKVQVHVDG